MRLATFNVQNMRLRRTPGAVSLDGARDRDSPLDDTGPATLLDSYDRALTAKVIAAANPDVIALQEVFDASTLDHFHDTELRTSGVAPYPFRYCLPGNDGRGLDVAMLCRIEPVAVTSHAGLRAGDLGLATPQGMDPAQPIFRRDCLEVAFRGLTVFNCHFKAPYPDPVITRTVRHFEAVALRALIEQRFRDPATAHWIITGDLNAPRSKARPADSPVRPPFSVDLMARRPSGDRWTYHDPHSGRYGQPDVMLASPALASACPDAIPEVVRTGMGHEASRHRGARLPNVGQHRPHASDHALLVIDLPGF
ncbi:endonuclease/exonuclease/phosphatase family protein [Shimia biformata]|uniref:endonuclease/exonuclease/phosphatase family protein n=1 Tax=Shimia biformata TaxID=1294299 RepID=UPI0019511325|nr:endonuclease/exonuclease/phosphatase family protein [Shimia biformata]